MTYTDQYKCNLCATIWKHEWETADYNNNFTQCPNCFEFDFEEVRSEV